MSSLVDRAKARVDWTDDFDKATLTAESIRRSMLQIMPERDQRKPLEGTWGELQTMLRDRRLSMENYIISTDFPMVDPNYYVTDADLVRPLPTPRYRLEPKDSIKARAARALREAANWWTTNGPRSFLRNNFLERDEKGRPARMCSAANVYFAVSGTTMDHGWPSGSDLREVAETAYAAVIDVANEALGHDRYAYSDICQLNNSSSRDGMIQHFEQAARKLEEA